MKGTYKYYKKGVSPGVNVNYDLFDKDGTIIENHREAACFHSIIYGAIPKNTKKIVVWHSLGQTPYDQTTIKKFIEELNFLKFPCSLEFKGANLQITLNLDDYKYKLHICSTLTIIRCLYEKYICYMPDHYFQLVEKDKDGDRFQYLQEAHKLLKKYEETCYYNSNHMWCPVEYCGEKNISQKVFWDRMEKSGLGVYDPKRSYEAIFALTDTREKLDEAA